MKKKTIIVLSAIVLIILIVAAVIIINNKEDRDQDFIKAKTQEELQTPQQENYLDQKPHEEENAVYCTQEVRQCPDGSYVGRVPPDCNFSPCPDFDYR